MKWVQARAKMLSGLCKTTNGALICLEVHRFLGNRQKNHSEKKSRPRAIYLFVNLQPTCDSNGSNT